MNIIEAINSGKRFRNKNDPGDSWLRVKGGYIAWPSGTLYSPEVESLTSDDWEIEEDKPELLEKLPHHLKLSGLLRDEVIDNRCAINQIIDYLKEKPWLSANTEGE